MTQTVAAGADPAHPDLVTLHLPPDRHAELVRLLHRHADHWLDEAERLDLAAEDYPARTAILTAAADRCRAQVAATLALREWAYSAAGPRRAVSTIPTAGGARVRVLASTNGESCTGAEWHCYGCLHTAVECPSLDIAEQVAGRHAELCRRPPAPVTAPYLDSVARPADDFWRCPCGNDPLGTGFSACDAQGRPIQPHTDSGWDQFSNVCLNCGRVIEQDAGIVLARVSPTRADSDQ